MSQPDRKPLPGAALALGAALLWSTGGVVIKYVPAEGTVVAALRCLIAGLVFLPWFRPRRLRFSWKLALLLAAYPVMTTSFVLANKWTTAANAVAIQYTAPLWIFAGAAVLGSIRLSWRRLLPMAVIAAGIALFLTEPIQGSSLKGNLTALVSGVSFALTIVALRLLRDQHNYSLVCLSNLVSAAVLVPWIFATGQSAQLAGLDAWGWTALLYLGPLQIGLAYALYSAGLKRLTALKASTISLVEPVLNPIWTFLFLAEVPTNHGFAGAAAILAGVVLDLHLNSDSNRGESPRLAMVAENEMDAGGGGAASEVGGQVGRVEGGPEDQA